MTNITVITIPQDNNLELSRGTKIFIFGVELPQVITADWRVDLNGPDNLIETEFTFRVGGAQLEHLKMNEPSEYKPRAHPAVGPLEGQIKRLSWAIKGGNADRTTAELIRFLAARLVHVYGEKPNIDFITAAHERARMLEDALK